MDPPTAVLALVIILIIILVYRPDLIQRAKDSLPGQRVGQQPASAPVASAPAAPAAPARKEHMSTPASGLPAPISDALVSMGYTGGVPWSEVIQATEVDPATFASQAEYVRDVRRFSSGANFTNVADDDNNLAFVNFVGLQRPQHVPIGESARQQPDIDQSVLQRNKQLRF